MNVEKFMVKSKKAVKTQITGFETKTQIVKFGWRETIWMKVVALMSRGRVRLFLCCVHHWFSAKTVKLSTYQLPVVVDMFILPQPANLPSDLNLASLLLQTQFLPHIIPNRSKCQFWRTVMCVALILIVRFFIREFEWCSQIWTGRELVDLNDRWMQVWYFLL